MEFAKLTKEVQNQIKEYAQEDINLARENGEMMITNTRKGLVELRVSTKETIEGKIEVWYNLLGELSFFNVGTDEEIIDYLCNEIYQIG